MAVANWWILFFGIISILTIISIGFAFALPDGSSKELATQISIILVPIIVGGFATRFTTNSWQITKEKIAIKRNILSDYEQSYKSISLLMENFVYRLTEFYVVYEESTETIPFEDYSNSGYAKKAIRELKSSSS